MVGGSGFGDGHEIDACEDQYNGDGFREGEMIHTEIYSDYGGHDWLNVIIHTDNGRAKVFLPYHDANVCYEGGEEDNVSDSDPLLHGDRSPVSGCHETQCRRYSYN